MCKTPFWMLFAALLCFSVSCWGEETKLPEIRAIWIARWDMASPEACKAIVELSKQHNFNSIVAQVRGRGDALYNSRLEPRSELLDAQSPDWDPLAQLIKEGHAAGLQIHAWINANYTWGSATPPASPEHIVNKRPDWLMRTNENVVNMVGGDDVEGAYTCPSNAEFREFLRDIYLDVVDKYDVDGVHFDFIRYPSTRFCYCERCLKQFAAEMDDKLTEEQRLANSNLPDRMAYTKLFPQAWDDYRRDQITKTVYLVYDAVKKAKPRVAVSTSVFPNYHDAYNHRFQDWKKWMKDRKVDIMFPMAYSKDTETFSRNIQDAIESSGGIPVVAGIGSWQIPADSTVEKILEARKLGAAGFCLFSWGITKSGADSSYLQVLKEEVIPQPVPLREAREARAVE